MTIKVYTPTGTVTSSGTDQTAANTLPMLGKITFLEVKQPYELAQVTFVEMTQSNIKRRIITVL